MDWQKIKAEYIAGRVSLRQLSEKYGVSFSTIQKKSMEEKWGDLRKKGRRRAEEKIIEAVSSKEARKAVDIADVADKLLEMISNLAETMVTDTQSLKQLTSALKDLKDIKGYKSAKDLEEQEARIRKLQKESEDKQTDNEIRVVISADAEDYSI